MNWRKMKKTFTVTTTIDDHDDEDFQYHLEGPKLANQLQDIANHVFRPARKHGYHNKRLNKLIENDEVCEAIAILEEMFYEIRSGE